MELGKTEDGVQRSEDGEQRMPRETNLNILFLNPAISTCTISGYGKTRHD
jgi:hypothetical protein